MFKKWKLSPFSSSSSSFVPVNEDAQRESLLLGPEDQQQIDTDLILTNQQQNKFPLLIYWIYFVYGVAMLLPWNVFITASDYFSVRFTGSVYQDSFQNYFSAYFNCSNLISLAVLLWIRQKKNVSSIDIIVPLLINLAIFSFFALSSLATPKESNAISYFWITIACMMATGVTTSVMQLIVLAETSQLLPKYMQAVMSGQGIAGVSVAVFSFLTTLIFKRQQLDAIATFYYFALAMLMTLIALIGRLTLVRHPAYQLLVHHSSTTFDNIAMDFTTSDNTSIPSRTTAEVPMPNGSKSVIWDIIVTKSPGYIFTIVYIYIITLALFPSVTVLVRSVNDIDAATFVSLHFLLFNIGDWLGRTLPIFTSFQVYSSKALVCLSLARTLFIPLLFSCNLLPLLEEESNAITPPLNSDLLYFIILLLFAISNGWLTSLVFIAAPREVSHNEKPLVGNVISFFLVVGLALGGLSSFYI